MSQHTTIIVYINQVAEPNKDQAKLFTQPNLCQEVAEALRHGLIDYDKYGIDLIRVATPDGLHSVEM
jgi:hypothetical protein